MTNRDDEQFRRYERIFATSADHMALLDRGYVYQIVNDAYLKGQGKTREQIIGHSVAELFGEEFFKTRQKPHIDRCLAGEIVCYQLFVELPGLGRRFMDVAHHPYREADGTISGYVVNARDITEQKELEQQLHRAQRMEALGTLAAGIAHDFNNVLGVIMGSAELAQLSEGNPETVRKHLQTILDAVDRAKDLVAHIGSTTRRRPQQEHQPLSLAEAVADSLALLRPSLPRTVEIRSRLDEEAPPILGDETQIEQIVMNLCNNAVHAMDGGPGTLEIEVATEGEQLVLRVSDTGRGIPKELCERIFDPYFTTKAEGEGSGLGLSIAYGIVRNHGGDIRVISEPAQGATFEIRFPRATESSVRHAAERPLAAGGDERVFFVDDEPQIGRIGRTMLESLGYRVTSYTDPVQALEDIAQAPSGLDLLVSDVTMPRMKGTELLELVRKVRPGLPVVLTSGVVERVDCEENVPFLTKPYTKAQLAATVRQALDES